MKLARLELKTDDAGTIAFEWDNIASVESTRQFEIGTTDDRRVLGSLQPGVGRVVRLVTNSGDIMLPMPEITTIYPIGASFWKKLDGGVNIGYSYTRSSAIGQFSLNWDTTFRRPAFVIMLKISGTVTEQPGSRERRSRHHESAVRAFSGSWFGAGIGSFEEREPRHRPSIAGRRSGWPSLCQHEQSPAVRRRRPCRQQRAGGRRRAHEELRRHCDLRSSYYTYDGSKPICRLASTTFRA